MPHAYAVETVDSDVPNMLDEAESFEIGDNDIVTFYSNTVQRSREVAFFNWNNVTTILPLSEDEYDEIIEML